MQAPATSQLDANGLRVAVAVSGYHEEITGPMADAAKKTFLDAGGRAEDLLVVPVAGSFELTAVCRALAHRTDLDGIVAIGCVIRGETSHDEHICRAVAGGLTDITVRTGVPIAFGVLTCQTRHQARARAGGERGNKGVEAMAAAIETARTVRELRERP